MGHILFCSDACSDICGGIAAAQRACISQRPRMSNSQALKQPEQRKYRTRAHRLATDATLYAAAHPRSAHRTQAARPSYIRNPTTAHSGTKTTLASRNHAHPSPHESRATPRAKTAERSPTPASGSAYCDARRLASPAFEDRYAAHPKTASPIRSERQTRDRAASS